MKFRFAVGLAAFAAIASTSHAVSLQSQADDIDLKSLFGNGFFPEEAMQNQSQEDEKSKSQSQEGLGALGSATNAIGSLLGGGSKSGVTPAKEKEDDALTKIVADQDKQDLDKEESGMMDPKQDEADKEEIKLLEEDRKKKQDVIDQEKGDFDKLLLDMKEKKETEKKLEVEELKEKERMERQEAQQLKDELKEIMDKQKKKEEDEKEKEKLDALRAEEDIKREQADAAKEKED